MRNGNGERGTWSRTVVLKLGGSVLVDVAAYGSCARLLRERISSEPGTRFVIIVSARLGETDALLALAHSISSEPDRAALDLLWSTGEVKSAATLALCLQAVDVRAMPLDVHQTGIHRLDTLHVDATPLRCALAQHDVVIVPGFLASGLGGAVVSLGRGSSDLTAVAVAAALAADRCELIKDVPGYFTTDPNRVPDAEHLPRIDYDRALQMAHEGCVLVQPAALDTARHAGLTLIIRAPHDSRHTTISEDGRAAFHSHEPCGASLRSGNGTAPL